MTERNEDHMTLSPSVEKFIVHWGEMGARWGINRTIAQIHALLYISERPLDAEEIAETLSIARSNVSVSLRELQSWGIVRTQRVLGERRDQFVCVKDVWEMFRIILAERKKRELDPTTSVLRNCALNAQEELGNGHYAAQRLQEALGMFEEVSNWYEQIDGMSTDQLRKAMKMGGTIVQLAGGRKKQSNQ